MKHYDFIGDIHGYSDHLEKLLNKLGYSKDQNGVYSHPENRQVFFVGDFIDRGPNNPKVIEIVRAMIENGSAKAVLGNHEVNAIQFNTKTNTGYIRPHSIKNFKQHSETMTQFHEHSSQDKYDEMIEWFKTLPLFLETDEFRVVHASWNDEKIQVLKEHTNNGVVKDWSVTTDKDHLLSEAIEVICKGVEEALPGGISFKDKDGTTRRDIRIKWWEDPTGKSIRDMSVLKLKDESPKLDLPFQSGSFTAYQSHEKPIFFGHYWMKGNPILQTANACCLDFSVAKEGVLTAYRWDGEEQLSEDNLDWV